MQVIAKDAEWRAAVFASDKARKDRNKVQQEVSKKKKAKEECDDLIKQIQNVRGGVVKTCVDWLCRLMDWLIWLI